MWKDLINKPRISARKDGKEIINLPYYVKKNK